MLPALRLGVVLTDSEQFPQLVEVLRPGIRTYLYHVFNFQALEKSAVTTETAALAGLLFWRDSHATFLTDQIRQFSISIFLNSLLYLARNNTGPLAQQLYLSAMTEAARSPHQQWLTQRSVKEQQIFYARLSNTLAEIRSLETQGLSAPPKASVPSPLHMYASQCWTYTQSAVLLINSAPPQSAPQAPPPPSSSGASSNTSRLNGNTKPSSDVLFKHSLKVLDNYLSNTAHQPSELIPPPPPHLIIPQSLLNNYSRADGTQVSDLPPPPPHNDSANADVDKDAKTDSLTQETDTTDTPTDTAQTESTNSTISTSDQLLSSANISTAVE